MSEPLMDFACYVGKYEIKRRDELADDEFRSKFEPPNMPFLVQVGTAKLVKPKHDHLRGAVGLLLQTSITKWRGGANKRYRAVYDDGDIDAPFDIDAEELSALKKNVLLIARHIGMLHGGKPYPRTDGECESLENWVGAAEWIQRAFAVRDLKDNYARVVGRLEIHLANVGHRISMHIRPGNTHDALMYVAAMEIARGTTFQACDKCGKPFLEGGGRDRRNKKRAGSRFCSDKCRYEYHNEQRRKNKTKP